MKKQQTGMAGPQAATPVPHKKPYAPPTATFVPLKLEERLLGCIKMDREMCSNAPSSS